MEDYEEKKFVAKTENITLGEMLDIWLEEEVKPGTLSTGTLIAYTTTARQIKKHPIGQRKLKSITADHLQEYIDFLSFGGTRPDGTEAQPISKNYMLQFSAVLRGSFRFAVFPKRYITFNPMQYVRMRVKKEEAELFEGNAENETDIPTITHEQYTEITDYLRKKRNPYSGLLRHTGRDTKKSQKATAQRAFPVWRNVFPQLLSESNGKGKDAL